MIRRYYIEDYIKEYWLTTAKIEGEPIDIFINPTNSELTKEYGFKWNMSQYPMIRGLITLVGEVLYVWSGENTTHYQVLNFLKLDSNDVICLELSKKEIRITNTTLKDGVSKDIYKTYCYLLNNSQALNRVYLNNIPEIKSDIY